MSITRSLILYHFVYCLMEVPLSLGLRIMSRPLTFIIKEDRLVSTRNWFLKTSTLLSAEGFQEGWLRCLIIDPSFKEGQWSPSITNEISFSSDITGTYSRARIRKTKKTPKKISQLTSKKLVLVSCFSFKNRWQKRLTNSKENMSSDTSQISMCKGIFSTYKIFYLSSIFCSWNFYLL